MKTTKACHAQGSTRSGASALLLRVPCQPARPESRKRLGATVTRSGCCSRFWNAGYRIKPDTVCVDDLDAPRVLAFLDDLERRRGNTARTRNNRRAAIRSFLRYAAAANPLLLPVAQRVLAIPAKRFERATVGYLTREQIQAILDSPDDSHLLGATRPGSPDASVQHRCASVGDLPVSGFRMCRWNRGCRFIFAAKVARIVRCRFGDRPSSCCDPGCDNSTTRPNRPCCRTPEAIP